MSNLSINDLYPRIRRTGDMFDDYNDLYKRLVLGEWPDMLSQDTYIGGLTMPYKGGEESENERVRRIL